MSQRGASIILIGFMGAGKTSTGRSLAQKTGLPFRDTDEIISNRFGLPISEIFKAQGEKAFRDRESEILTELGGDSAIIATGGGIVLRTENVTILRKLGQVVWLDADPEALFGRACQGPVRPLLQNADPRATFMKLLQVREPLYRRTADVRLDSSKLRPDEVANAILKWISR